MIRVLFIARYRDATMRRKVDLMAAASDVALRLVVPQLWQDEFGRIEQADGIGTVEQAAIAMRGSLADPHRATYRTLDFGLRSFRPHIIHAEEEPDSLAALQIALARRLFAPRARLLLHTWQNVDRPRKRAVRWVTAVTLHASAMVFCANTEAAAILRRHGYSRPLPVLPAVGVDTETFLPCMAAGRAPAPFTVGYVGRFVPEKGIDTLLRAFAAFQVGNGADSRLHLFGGGPLRTELRNLAIELGIQTQTEFFEPLPPAQLARQMCKLDVLVLPSRTTTVWKEQLGRVLLEAMACGVPVVGSDSGAIPEVIGAAGLIFPEGDAAALADELALLATQPALAAELRHRGLARMQASFNQRFLADQTLAVYRSFGVGASTP